MKDDVNHSVPKLNGFDIELANYIEGLDLPGGTGREASLALLRQFEGISPLSRWAGGYTQQSWYQPGHADDGGGWGQSAWSDQQWGASTQSHNEPPAQCTDWGRKWLPSNGACAYIDLNHLECCGAEVLGARDHVAMWHAMLLKTRQARTLANAMRPEGQQIEVLANNSDGLGNSYGGHIDILISRKCYENVLHRKMHLLSILAAHQASSIVYTGAGKVGVENGHEHVNYQFSQRADFVEQLLAPQTTYRRPLVNTRDESLCGSWQAAGGSDDAYDRLARLHVISYDTNLCHVATFLKVGTLQLVLCMLEEEEVVPGLILDDPVDAIARWSHGDLRTTVRMASGNSWTAVEVQESILERAAEFVNEGRAEGLVPEAETIIALWSDTLSLLRQNDISTLAKRCDWALKLLALDRAMVKHQKEWSSPEIKTLDHMYSSVDPIQGLFWQYQAAGVVERLVSDADIESAAVEPPDNTRAWLRSKLLRLAQETEVEWVDWDSIRLRPGKRFGSTPRTVHMGNPLAFTRNDCERTCAQRHTLEEALDTFGIGADSTWQTGTEPAFPGAAFSSATAPGATSAGPLLLPAQCEGARQSLAVEASQDTVCTSDIAGKE